jgi:transposase
MKLDPFETPTMTVDQVAQLLGVGRATAYREANRYVETSGTAGIPALRVGGRFVCPTALVLRMLGLAE